MTATVTTYGPTVGVRDLAGGAWRTLRAHAGEAWPLLAPMTAAAILNGVLVHTAKAAGQESPFALINLGKELVGALTTGVLSGVSLRIFLGRGGAAWRPDRELGAYVALTMLITFGTTLAIAMPEALFPSKAQALERLGALVVFGFGSLWLGARLTLWPIAQLMGERRASALDSAHRMQGVVWTYWFAILLAAAPPLIPGVILDWPYVRQGQVVGLLLSAPFFAVSGLLAAAVQAELFRAKWLRD